MKLALAKHLKTADFFRCYYWFSRKMMTDVMSLAISWHGFLLVENYYSSFLSHFMEKLVMSSRIGGCFLRPLGH